MTPCKKLLVILGFATVILQNVQHVSALNILAIVSLPLKSHYMAFQTLFRELAIRGHSVTVMNNYPEDNPPPNLKFVHLNAELRRSMLPMSAYEPLDSTYSHLLNFNRHFILSPDGATKDCENFFTNKDVKTFLQKGEKIDVIFVEQFMSDCGLVFAAALYDAPIIGITSHTLLPWAYPRMGIPFDISSDSFYFSNAGTNPSLRAKLENFSMNLYMNTLGKWKIQRHITPVFEKYLPGVESNVDKIAKDRMQMMFVNQHHSVTGARLLSPQILEIGGIHIGKSKAVPGKIEKFLSTAKHGAIYVSFGSNLKASTMTPGKMQHFLNAFKKIPQKVLWKLENMTLPDGYENVLIDNWFPQLDVLCHPKVLAFVSHGGMLSLSEAAHCGKPLLTIPFFGDQYSNSAMVAESGLGTTMFFDRLDADSLVDTIQHLTSPKMQDSAQKVSKRWHDRPQNVLDSAIFWTEYVARHRSAPPPLPATRKTWFETSLVDVYSVLIGVLLAIFLIIYYIVKLIKLALTAILGKFSSKNKQKTKRKRA